MKKIFTIIKSTGSYDDHSEVTIAAYEDEQDMKHDLAILNSIHEEIRGESWRNLYDPENDNAEVDYMIKRFKQIGDLFMSFTHHDKMGRRWPAISHGDYADFYFALYADELNLY